MQVVLLNDVKKVGRKFELVKVSDGYAQSILLPRGLAVPATPGNIKKYTAKLVENKNKKAVSNKAIEDAINLVAGKRLYIQASASETGTLFQAIHKKDIATALQKEFSVLIPDSMIEVDDIKKVGEYSVSFSGNKKRSIVIEVL